MSKSRDAFRTISEVAEWLDTPAHVLRFWESKFPQVKPVKRAGGRRYYRPADMTLLGGIKKLLHDDGLTIKGVQKVLSEQGVKAVSAMAQPIDDDTESAPIEASRSKAVEDDDVPARIEDSPEADMDVDAAPEADDAIEDAPFIEAEPPTSTVIPFTGGALAETPGRAKASAPKTSPDEDTPLPASENAETSGDAQDIVEAPLPEDAIAASDMDDIAPAAPDDPAESARDADANEAMQDAAAATSESDIDALVAETIGSEAAHDEMDQAEEAGSAEDAAPPAKSEAAPAAEDTNEAPEQPSLFGTTPEFLAKPFSDRESEQAEAPQPEDAAETVAEEETPAEIAAASEKADTSAPDIADEDDTRDEETGPENTGQEATDSDNDATEATDAVTADDADRTEDSAPQPDAALPDAAAHEPVPGPLRHLARIPRLTPEMAERMAPHVAALGAHLDAGA